MKTPEGIEKAEIRKYLNSIGAYHVVTHMTGFGKGGVSDIVACVPLIITYDMVGQTIGAFVTMEVKREGKEPTPRQNTRMDEVKQAYGAPFWGTAGKVIQELKIWMEIRD